MGLDNRILPKRPFKPLKGKGKGAERLVRGGALAPAAFPAIADARETEHWLRVFEAERREVLDALHDLQQRFAEEADTSLARLAPRRGGGLIWRLRAATPSGANALRDHQCHGAVSAPEASTAIAARVS